MASYTPSIKKEKERRQREGQTILGFGLDGLFGGSHRRESVYLCPEVLGFLLLSFTERLGLTQVCLRLLEHPGELLNPRLVRPTKRKSKRKREKKKDDGDEDGEDDGSSNLSGLLQTLTETVYVCDVAFDLNVLFVQSFVEVVDVDLLLGDDFVREGETRDEGADVLCGLLSKRRGRALCELLLEKTNLLILELDRLLEALVVLLGAFEESVDVHRVVRVVGTH